MRVVIRADASPKMGSGHIMRCLALAGALRKRGALVSFVCSSLPDNLKNLIGEHDFYVAEIQGELLDSAAGRTKDAERTVAAIDGEQVDWIIVDHYELNSEWELTAQNHCRHIAVIDDLANRQHYCDLLVDSNMIDEQATRYRGRVPAHCTMLLGPKFLLLREEFQDGESFLRMRDQVQNTLVMFGGYDVLDLTSRVVEMLRRVSPDPGEVHVVVGRHNPWRERVMELCCTAGYEMHTQTDSIADLMRNADIAISACGLSAYELIALGVPSLLIAVTPIQEQVACTLSASRMADVLSLGATLDYLQFAAAWEQLASSRVSRSLMSEAAKGLIDGRGAARVAATMSDLNARG
jgi:UDP-2,4-diacetamido-2,4,6-trideoxy-beta-L-altropyranose hydrolase